MKFKKTTAIAVTACIAGSAIFSLAGCGDGGLGHGVGEKPIGDRTEIFFYCDGNEVSEKGWLELIEAYNDGAGYETDQVYVTADIEAGISSSSGNEFIQDTDYAYNVVAINDGQDEDFKKNTIPDRVLNWWRMKYDGTAASGAGKPKHIVGAGQDLMAVPYGTDPQFNWYNKALFQAQGINIVSIPEEQLDKYNSDNNASIKPQA